MDDFLCDVEDAMRIVGTLGRGGGSQMTAGQGAGFPLPFNAQRRGEQAAHRRQRPRCPGGGSHGRMGGQFGAACARTLRARGMARGLWVPHVPRWVERPGDGAVKAILVSSRPGPRGSFHPEPRR